MKRSLIGLALTLGALSAPAQVGIPTQEQGAPSLSTGTVPLTYTGGDGRVSVGVDQDGHSTGELMGVFGNNGEHAFVAQFWWGHGGAGGAQGDYNWLFGSTPEQVRKDPDSITVAKLSFAIDQNEEKDRMANVGLSIERKEFFLNFFLSGRASSSRNAGAVNTQQQSVASGTDEVGNFSQTQTDVTTTQLQAQPYSYTVGVHGGHFSDALTARFNGGVDYAKGSQGASQTRVSVGVDKYLGTGGWSVSGQAEHAQNNDPLGQNNSDNRWWLFLRYEFGGGGAFRSYPDSASADAAWVDRALHTPVTGHPRTFDTYVKRGSTSTTTTQGPKQYTAHRPIARDDITSVTENSTDNAVDVLANDTDPDGNALTVTSTGTPGHGTARISGTQVLYTPMQGYVGSDQFGYTITNSKGLTATATVFITVTASSPPPPPPPPPGAPVARDDTATTPYATPVTINVLANDSDPNKYPLTVTAATSPGHGTARVNPDGSITYTPNSSYLGSDRFSYSISNGHGGTASANVIITVLPAPPPIARDDTATTPYATPVNIDVLANDTDPAGLFLTVQSVGNPSSGTATILAAGPVRYTPSTGFIGTDHFSYTISDGHGGLASANVTVTVLQPGVSLIAQNDVAQTPYVTPVAINVLANDTASLGLTLTITGVSTPAHGTAQIGNNGVINYTPATNFDGLDTFTYTVTDGVTAATAKVNVTVLPPPPPVAQNDTATTAFGKPVTINVLANDSDPDNLALTVTGISPPPQHGGVQISNNSIVYSPPAGFFGQDVFGYTISNGHGGTASANVDVTVNAPLPPIAVADASSTSFQTSVQINVLSNDSDPNGLPLSVVGYQAPPFYQGSLAQNGNTFTFKPAQEFYGVATFTYTISDNYGQATATVTVTVNLPAQPIAKSFPYSGPPTCDKDGSYCDICLDDHITNDNGLPIQVSASPTSAQGGTVVQSTISGCHYAVRYTTPDPSDPSKPVDTFTFTVKDITFNRTSTGTVTVTINFP